MSAKLFFWNIALHNKDFLIIFEKTKIIVLPEISEKWNFNQIFHSTDVIVGKLSDWVEKCTLGNEKKKWTKKWMMKSFHLAIFCETKKQQKQQENESTIENLRS